MKENSIEENIEILENFINVCNEDLCTEISVKCDGFTRKAIEHILSDYKRVLKENEELKADNYELNNRITDLLENIPVQKIKAKIEEIDIAILECEYLDDDDEEYKKAVEKDKLCLLNQKRILQELLESENK